MPFDARPVLSRCRHTVAFARFALVGGLFAVANLFLLTLLVSGIGVHYLSACAISFFTLNFLSYLLNKTFTFRLKPQVVMREVTRYYLVMASSLAANLSLMYLLVDFLSWHYLLASLVVVIALSIFNFAGHVVFSFGSDHPQHDVKFDVLQVSAFFPEHGGGIEAVAGHLAAAWGKAGYRIAWCGSRGGADAASADASGVTRFQAGYWDPLEKRIGLPLPIWHPTAALIMWRVMQQSRVVQLHDALYFPCILAAVFAWIQRKPVVLTQHIGEIPIRSAYAREAVRLANKTVGKWMLGCADQVVFIATPVQDYFTKFVHFKSPPLLIANGVDHDIFHPATERASTSYDVHLMFVGRFVEKKGIHLLRKSTSLPGVRWTFAGWGPLDPAEWPNLPPSVVLAGHITSDQLAPLYRAADLLVLPSVGEGFPLVVQEALACGTPVLVSQEVASACPARDPLCVFDVDVSGPDADKRVEEAIVQLTADPAMLRTARTKAARLAQQWSWDSCAAAYTEIYSMLLQAPCAAKQPAPKSNCTID